MFLTRWLRGFLSLSVSTQAAAAFAGENPTNNLVSRFELELD